jgi:ABC-type transporter Mla subunit MlaD
MAVQDLTPQLRTRLSRLEKVVGWFVTLGVLLLLGGLSYYIYSLAERKGWFVPKAPYYIYLESGAGLNVGDSVRLMGFPAGRITNIKPMPPDSRENVYVEFEIHGENIGYVWDDSQVKVRSAGLLGARFLEVIKGGTVATNSDVFATYKVEKDTIVSMFDRDTETFTNWTKGGPAFWLVADEPPELSSQLDQTVQMLKVSLTNILQLTNAITRTLTNAAEVTANLNDILLEAKPVVANAATITSNLKEPRGSLGEWLFPVAMNYQLTSLLTNAGSTVLNVNSTVTNANTNLVGVFSNITVTLENIASMTSNLNAQVQRNNNIVSSVSRLIVNTDDMVQGLKRHWLLRSAFKERDAAPPRRSAPRRDAPVNPKGAGRD